MYKESILNNRVLLDSLNNIVRAIEDKRGAMVDETFYMSRSELRKHCFITWYWRDDENGETRLMPIILRPQKLSAEGLLNPSNYSLWAAPTLKELNKMCIGQKLLVEDSIMMEIAKHTSAITRETYDIVQNEGKILIREILRVIENENKNNQFEDESRFIQAVDDTFKELADIYMKHYDPTPNKILLDSLSNIFIKGSEKSKDIVDRHPYSYIMCSTIDVNRIIIMPLIGRPQLLKPKEFSNPNNYSICAAPSKRAAKKMCAGQKILAPIQEVTFALGVSREGYDRIKTESERLIKEILTEIARKYKNVNFKSESELAKAVDDSFLLIYEVYEKKALSELPIVFEYHYEQYNSDDDDDDVVIDDEPSGFWYELKELFNVDDDYDYDD